MTLKFSIPSTQCLQWQQNVCSSGNGPLGRAVEKIDSFCLTLLQAAAFWISWRFIHVPMSGTWAGKTQELRLVSLGLSRHSYPYIISPRCWLHCDHFLMWWIQRWVSQEKIRKKPSHGNVTSASSSFLTSKSLRLVCIQGDGNEILPPVREYQRTCRWFSSCFCISSACLLSLMGVNVFIDTML